MINYQTILSNYNKRGTLLKWLRTLQTALEEGALETVTTTTTEDSVVFHFGFADGTSVDSPPIQLEAGPQGPEGPEGPEGPQGPAATISIGSVTTLPAGSSATVVNSGTSGAAVFDFGIPEGDTGPQGEDGPQGPAATVAICTVTTLSPGSNATVTNSGTSSAAVFDFGIPQGANGDPGEVIEQIVPVETTTTASRPYAKDAYFVNNLGILVQATANIALGATIDSTNTTAANKTLSEALNKKWVLKPYSLIMPTTVTTTATSYATFAGRLISDYALIVIEFKNSNTDLRASASIIPSYTGKTTLECLHGGTGGTITGYQRAAVTVQKIDDTHFEMQLQGSGTIKIVEIYGYKVEEII